MAGSARHGHSRGQPSPQQGRRGLDHGGAGLSSGFALEARAIAFGRAARSAMMSAPPITPRQRRAAAALGRSSVVEPARCGSLNKVEVSIVLKAVLKHPVLADVAIGLFAGLAATQLTNVAQRPLKWLTPDRVAFRERLARPGASSSLVAAEKVTQQVGVSPSRRQMEFLGTAIHFGTGIAWGPVYGLLRRYVGLRPVGAALTSGAAMSLILDEGLVPVLGLSAPNRRYPAFTRVRGLLAHLVYGAAVGLADEGLGRLVKRPTRSRTA